MTTDLAGLDPDLDLAELTLDWVTPGVGDQRVRGALTAITVERTIDGASTITVTLEDPDGAIFADSHLFTPKSRSKAVKERDVIGAKIRRPRLRGRALEITLDGIVFRLVKVSKSGTSLTLTFEDRIIYWLRQKHGTKRASRGKMTRAQFVLSMLREVKTERVRFVCPELDVKQDVAKPQVSKTSSGGLSKSPLKIQDAAGNTRNATPENRRIAERVLAVANTLKAGPKATLALIEACMIESGITNTPKGDASSVGVLQLLDMHGSRAKRMNVEWVVRKFLVDGFTGRGGAIALAKKNPNMTAGAIAQAVQGSAHGDRYDKVRNEAVKWVDAYGGSGTGGANAEADAAGGDTYYKSYQFAREAQEDSWTAIQRLAGEVGWRAFMVGRALYFMSEEDLYRRAVAYRLTPDDAAVLDLSYDVDWGKTTSEVTVSVVLGRWKAPPSTVVQLAGFGPPDGRWLVTSWRRDYFNPVAEITLRQPAREKLEPAPEAAQHADAGLGGDFSVGEIGLADSTHVVKAARRADAIDQKGQGYKWGGGHGSFNDSGGYDCSGFVSSCLHAAGLLKTPLDTGGLASWGEAGEGQYMTVWVKQTGDPHRSHTFMVFDLKGRKSFAEAGGAEKSHTGWHRPRSTAGFNPRHWPGT